MKTYTVIYRTGGRQNFQWKKAIPVVTYEEAFKMETELKTAGYHALIHDTEQIDRIGLPETFGPEDSVCEVDNA